MNNQTLYLKKLEKGEQIKSEESRNLILSIEHKPNKLKTGN